MYKRQSSDNPEKAIISLKNDRETDYKVYICLLYTSDAADDSLRVDPGGRRIIKKPPPRELAPAATPSHPRALTFFKQKTAYEIHERLVGSEMCIRDRLSTNLIIVIETIARDLSLIHI